MIAIRGWLLLVTLAAALFGTIVLAMPALDQEAMAKETSRRVDAAAHAAELLLRLHMQKWVETASALASDAVLGDALDEANRDSHELAMLTKSLQNRLRAAREKSHADLALVLDSKGRLVAESGGVDLKIRSSLAEQEAVAAALRGSRADAFWLLGGKAYRVAVAPASKERGVVALGQEIGPELLATIRDSIGSDLALATPDRVVAAVPALAQVADVPARIAARQKTDAKLSDKDKAKLDAAIALSSERIGQGRDSVLVAGRWLGDRQLGLVLCAIAPQPSYDSPLGRIEATGVQIVRALSSSGKSLQLVLILLGSLLFLIVIGQWLVTFDGSRPIRRLLGEAQLVARGDQQRLSAERLPKRFAVLARTLNAAFDRFGQRARVASASTSSPSRPTMPSSSSPSSLPPQSPAGSLPPLTPSSEHKVAMTGSFVNSPEGNTGDGMWAVAPQLGDMFAAPLPNAGPPPPGVSANLPAVGASRPAPSTPVPSAATPPEDPELRAVYRDFLETRETCGESTEGLTWDKFVARLLQTKAQVQKQQNCTEVKYGVYVKDGKAAIKVTPVK